MIFYAKSLPVETIKEHTEQLLGRLEVYMKIYKPFIPYLSDRDWELLKIAVLYHDIGKADVVFQNKIRKIIGIPLIETISTFDVPHNYLSVMAIPFKALSLSKEETLLIAQIVAFHHERREIPPFEQILSNYKENILPFREKIEKDHDLIIEKSPRASKMNILKQRILPSHPLYIKYVLLKGILHRLDHSASAHVPIELAHDLDVSSFVSNFFQEKLKVNKNPLQKFTESHQDKHLVVIAQTGMGKTEAGLLWLGNKKGFFTLPLRVSINSMYNRIINEIGFSKKDKEYGELAVGLLHSTSLDYLYDHYEGNDEILEKVHTQSKEFANKLVITTIDQILKFPFYYLGFEKEYASMAGSKVIIDELQAYDPKIAAVLIRALTLIDKIGGSFMIMTATLPDFYYKALQRELKFSKLPIKYGEFVDDSIKRHNVMVRNESIIDGVVIKEIHENSKNKKVLIICNTVDRAREVYDELINVGAEVHLLHARFNYKDRSQLEKKIIEFAKSDKYGIWVTTQLVEASLDIDFDVLYTEMSSLDSQFQRYGRCNRKGKKSIANVNVHVFVKDVSGVSKRNGVYHYEIFNDSLKILEKFKQGILLESIKHEMIKELYDEQRLVKVNSEFKKEFDMALKDLKERPHYEKNLTKGKAQELLRDILQVQVIPNSFNYDKEFQQKLNAWNNAKTRKEKRRWRKEIEAYSVSINKFRAEQMGLIELQNIKGLYFINCLYDKKRGLIYQQDNFS